MNHKIGLPVSEPTAKNVGNQPKDRLICTWLVGVLGLIT